MLKRVPQRATCVLILLVASALATAPALADKPSWAGGGKEAEHGQAPQEGHGKAKHGHPQGEHHFAEHQEQAVHDYYAAEIRGGKCPPGLAKKHNGCLPPGQAKKWQLGRPLPDGVAVHALPQGLSVELGVPPEGYRYVRVASDILLIAAGTNMVVDAIQDLGQHQGR
jgi:Ni/Co efflux regulator RcnB